MGIFTSQSRGGLRATTVGRINEASAQQAGHGMDSNDFHNALRPLEEAAVLTRSGMVCLANPLAPEGASGWDERPGLAKLRHQFWLWWRRRE